MSFLDIEEIKRDVTVKLEIVGKVEELQALVSRAYPGHRVFIASQEETRRREVSFSDMNGTDQLISTLIRHPSGLQLELLHGEISRRGGTMSMETMMSLLSRGKDAMFINVSRGVWAISPDYMKRLSASK